MKSPSVSSEPETGPRWTHSYGSCSDKVLGLVSVPLTLGLLSDLWPSSDGWSSLKERWFWTLTQFISSDPDESKEQKVTRLHRRQTTVVLFVCCCCCLCKSRFYLQYWNVLFSAHISELFCFFIHLITLRFCFLVLNILSLCTSYFCLL